MVEAGADPARVRVIGNGVDTALFHPGSREAARQALGWPRDRRIVLSVGALVPLKDYPRLLQAFPSVVASHDAHLYIVGDGPERGRLAALIAALGIAERVTLLGTVPPGDLGDVYRAADVFCLASRREGCPNVVREALACGVPVVATDVGGTPELIDGDDCGLLVPARDAEALGRALDTALSASWEPARIAAAPGVRTWDDAARESLALLEEAVAERAGEGAP
jgi:glycosyltransferase involved in cell wall biosynthesis